MRAARHESNSKRAVLECGQSHRDTHPRGLFRDETPVPGFQYHYMAD
jgi:hypothetical protein